MKNAKFTSETYVQLPDNKGLLKHTKETTKRHGQLYADNELIEILPAECMENFKITFEELKIPFLDDLDSLLIKTLKKEDGSRESFVEVYGDCFKYTYETTAEEYQRNRCLEVDFGWLSPTKGAWVMELIHSVRKKRDRDGWYHADHEGLPLKLKTVNFNGFKDNPPGGILAVARHEAITRFEEKSRQYLKIDTRD